MKTLYRCFFAFWIGALGVCVPADAAVNLLTGVNRDTLTIGDPIVFRIRITRAQADQASIVMGEGFPQPFEIRERRPPATVELDDGRVQETHDLILTVYQVGKCSIPPISVRFATAKGDSGSIQSRPVAIFVQSVKPEGITEPRDIKPPVAVQSQIPLWAWLALLGVVAVAAIIVSLWIRRRRKPRIEPPPPPINWAHEIQKIADLGLVEEKKYRQLYSLLSETLRRCLEAKTPVRAVERTTFEIVTDLRTYNFDDATIREVDAFLSEADMVKFAKFRPGETAARLSLDSAAAIVRTVVQHAEPKPAEEAVS